MINDNGIHGIVLGLQTDIAVLLVEGLDGRLILDQSDYDLTVSCSITGVDKQKISVEDTDVDHGISAHPKGKAVTGGDDLRGDREVVLNVLLCQDRLSGSYVSDDRKRSHFRPDHLETVVADLDRAGLGRVSSNIAVSLERVQMRVHG